MNDVVHYKSDTDQQIIFTEAARNHVLAYLAKQKETKGLRFSVKKTGCSGLSYVVDYVIAPQERDLIQEINENYQLYIDKASYPFLKGMKVDYVREGLNHKFVFINPNQTGQCGCGESFTVE